MLTVARLQHGCLSRQHSPKVLPIIFGALLQNSEGHWNPTVESLALNVLKHYKDSDPGLYDRCAQAYTRDREASAVREQERQAQWAAIERAAGI